MQAYVINLDRDVIRFEWMDTQLRELGIPYQRQSAVDGQKLSPAQQHYHTGAPGRADLSKPEIGCLLSHMQVWQRVFDDGRTALVMEDDIHLAPDFARLLASVRIQADERIVHRFETVLARVTASRATHQKIGRRRAMELYSNHAGAAAYLITPAAAGALLAVASRFTTLPDGEMFDFSRRAIRYLRVIQWSPAPCIQDQFLERNDRRRQFGSHLAGDRADIRSGRLKTEGPFEGLRTAFRPAWTLARGALLAPLGRDRLLVPWR